MLVYIVVASASAVVAAVTISASWLGPRASAGPAAASAPRRGRAQASRGGAGEKVAPRDGRVGGTVGSVLHDADSF